MYWSSLQTKITTVAYFHILWWIELNQQTDIHRVTSINRHQQSEIFRVISIKWIQLINLDSVTSTRWHWQWTSTKWHQNNDINRVTPTEWHQQSDINKYTVWPCLLPPSDSVRYDFFPFTCRQWVPTKLGANDQNWSHHNDRWAQ